MAKTYITWTDYTWNPWQGCHKVSSGCKNCYMYTEKNLYGQDPATVVRSKDATFYAPLKWEKAAAASGVQQKVFACSWSDFFIEEADSWRDEALAIMALTPHLTYQILTKRPERMLPYITLTETPANILWAAGHLIKDMNKNQWGSITYHGDGVWKIQWPLSNVWLGVSVEDHEAADIRIPLLLQVPATLQFLSLEPLLAPVNLDRFLGQMPEDEDGAPYPGNISWCIIGGESGPQARPCHLGWIASLIGQCQAMDTAVFVKQFGKYAYDYHTVQDLNRNITTQCKGCMQCRYVTKDSKGADIEEFPENIRIREFPYV